VKLPNPANGGETAVDSDEFGARSLGASFVLEAFSERLAADSPATLFFDLRALVLLPRLMGLFVEQLVKTLETDRGNLTGGDPRANRASRLAAMPAIAEPALFGDRLDVGEGVADAVARVP
jgi:hypothetical protein